jgi:hypothetical protein
MTLTVDAAYLRRQGRIGGGPNHVRRKGIRIEPKIIGKIFGGVAAAPGTALAIIEDDETFIKAKVGALLNCCTCS